MLGLVPAIETWNANIFIPYALHYIILGPPTLNMELKPGPWGWLVGLGASSRPASCSSLATAASWSASSR